MRLRLSRWRSDRNEVGSEEPVLRLRHYLTELGHWTKADEERLLQKTAAEITAAADSYLAMPPQEPSTIFDYTFASLPAELAVQRQAALGRAGFAAPEAKFSNRTD